MTRPGGVIDPPSGRLSVLRVGCAPLPPESAPCRNKSERNRIEYESFGRDSDPLILLIMGLAAQLIFWPESLCKGLAARGSGSSGSTIADIGKSTHLASLPTPIFAP